MKSRFEALDGMRGVASMAVVAYHTGLALSLPSYLVVHGDIAVDFFFALSGFVLMHANGGALASGRLSAGKFMAMRVTRLWPMVVLGAVIAMISFGIRGVEPPGGVATLWLGLVALPAIVGAGLVFSNSVYWSLLGEFLANALFVIFSRFSAAVLVSLQAILFVAFAWLSITHGTIHFGFQYIDEFLPTMVRVLVSFNAGVLSWMAWSRFRDRVPSLNPALLAPVLLVPLLIPSGNTAVRLSVQLLYIGIGFPLLIMLGANAKSVFTRISTKLGDISYPLYAIHLPMVPLVVAHISPDGLAEKLLLEAALPIAFALIALPVDRFIDRPARALLRSVLVIRAPVAIRTEA